MCVSPDPRIWAAADAQARSREEYLRAKAEAQHQQQPLGIVIDGECAPVEEPLLLEHKDE